MKNTVQLRSRDRRTFHTRVGAEDMGPDAISDNIDVIIRRLEASLEGPLNIDGIYVKTTMGPAKEGARMSSVRKTETIPQWKQEESTSSSTLSSRSTPSGSSASPASRAASFRPCAASCTAPRTSG